MSERFFKKPEVDQPFRSKEFDYRPEDARLAPPDISLQTLEETTPPPNLFRAGAVRAVGLQRDVRRLLRKIEGTLDYHIADLPLDLGPETPLHIQQAVDELYGIPVPTILTPQQFKCAVQLCKQNKEVRKVKDQLDKDPDEKGPGEGALDLIQEMSNTRFSFGLEFLLRLIRLVLAYAVHMIIGGLCNFFLGKLDIPIPFVGSLPLGTMISQTILAPTERAAKAALGFPCNPKIPIPKFCFDLFTLDKDAANLLPCCLPSGLSGMQLRIQEMKEKTKGGSPVSNDIEQFLKSFEVKGGFKDGYIKFGDSAQFQIDKDLTKVLQDNPNAGPLEGMKEAVTQARQALEGDDRQQAILQDLLSQSSSAGGEDESAAAVQNAVDSWFQCVAQALLGVKHDEPNNPYQGPPCLNADNSSNSSSIHRDLACSLVEHIVAKASASPDPGPTNPQNVSNLVSVWMQTENMDDSLGEMKGFLKENQDLLNPSTKRCIEEMEKPFNLKDQLASVRGNLEPEAFLERLDTDNSMSNISLSPTASTEIAGGDVGDIFARGLQGTDALAGIGETMEAALDNIESFIQEVDRYVSATNKLSKFFTSREFCCVIFLIVLLGNVARGKTLCPRDDISQFFKYSAEFSDRKDVAILKQQIAFLKAIIDAIRVSLSIGFTINGINIPLKDLMEQVRYTISNVSKALVDVFTEPFETALDQILLNPEVQALVANNCFFAFDIMSMLKCGLEWFKIKMAQLALTMFENNFQNIELMRTLRVGNMRWKILDLLSKLLGQILKLLLGIGDCYDGDDYTRAMVGGTLEQQYSDAERVFQILDKGKVTPEEVDAWSQTLNGEDPLNVSVEEIQEADVQLDDFFGSVLTEKMVDLLRNPAPLAAFVDESTEGRRLVDYNEFVGRIEEFTGVSVSDIYVDLFNLDGGIYQIFRGEGGQKATA